jgi:rfaE bifunctional protein nucleotidyltransferase chain/domain
MGLIVQAHGTWDGLHVGHVAHLQAARALGDILIVTITADKWVAKGDGRPVFSQEERRAMLRAMTCVGDAIIIDAPGAEEAIYMVQPNIYVKGKEYEGWLPEQTFVESLGARVVFLDTQPVYSSTRLLTGEELNARIGSARTRSA